MTATVPTGHPLPVTRVPGLLAGGPALVDHLAAHGPLPAVGPRLLDELARTGVDGRGGAGFPLAGKIEAVLRASGVGNAGRRPAVLVANGSEGEPASRKDAVLLHRAPHLVVDGIVVVARLAGATEAVVVAAPDGARSLRRALGERTDPVPVRVHELAHASFVSGEASAVASRVAGGPGVPVDHVDPLARRGPSGRRTLVANVETLAVAALVARSGADPATRLVSVSDVRAPAGAEVLEVADGTRLGDVVRASRQATTRARAVLVGGWGGVWVPPAALDAAFSVDGLAPWAATPGAGVVAVLDDATCPLGVVAWIAAALGEASAGRCGPCVNGLPRVADVLAELAGGTRRPGLVAEVRRVTALVDGRGACHHPDGVARMVRSAMAVFRDDVAAHLDGRCVAGGGRHSAGPVLAPIPPGAGREAP